MDTKKLRQKILDLAIHGRLVPQDPADEPASALLERIKAEKGRLVKEGKMKRGKETAKTSDAPRYPYLLPKGWAWCKLENCCHIAGRIGFRGYTKDDLVSEGNGAITLSPSNIIDGYMDFSKCTFISWEKYEESPEIQVKDGDILLVKTGSSFGKCALVKDLPCKSTINPQFVVLKHILIDNQFLTSVLQSQYARKNYDDFVLGTAIPTFTQAILGNMCIPLPPLAEQQRIVAEIERWFSLIGQIEQGKAGLQAAIKQAKSKILDLAIHGRLVPQDPADEPASALLERINPKAEIVCDNGDDRKLPNGWTITELINIVEIRNGYAFKSSKYISSNGVRIIRITNVQDGYIEDKKPQFYPLEEMETLKDFMLEKGDILMSLTGNVGRVGILTSDLLPAALNQRVACIKEHSGVIEKRYLFYIFQTNNFSKDCLKSGKGVAQLNISTEWLKHYSILLPPLAEQQRIVRKVEELFSALDNIQKALEA